MNIDKLDRQHTLFQKSLSCYLETIGGIEKQVIVGCMGASARQLSLQPLEQRLRAQIDESALDASRAEVRHVLEEASTRIRHQLASTVDLSEVVRKLAQTSASLQQNHSRNESRFLDVASDLRDAADSENTQELRQLIYQQVAQITHLVEDIKAENRHVIEGLESEMQVYRRRLDEAEEMANRDTLTGLPNRRALQTRVTQHIESARPFCLLLIDLNHFKRINDHYGHLVGDELLKLFAARLKSQLRTDDTPARWGGDEFVVLMSCHLRDAMARSRLLEQSLHGEYAVRKPSASLRVQIGLTIGVAKHRTEESADQLLARADQILYQRKAAR